MQRGLAFHASAGVLVHSWTMAMVHISQRLNLDKVPDRRFRDQIRVKLPSRKMRDRIRDKSSSGSFDL